MTNIAKTPTNAKSDTDADKKFQKYRSLDPFPGISPALLNSADFIDYILVTGMIYPFDPLNKKVIKSASLELDIANEVLYWDEKGERTYKPESTKNESIVFRKNSITFVTVNSMFRLPDYIALRFNLQIRHVHRGLLLGTGPLVDPGYEGRLMIPIHNLTENDYTIDPYKGLICVEFTKLSPNQKWDNSTSISFDRVGEYKSNEGKKDRLGFLELINKHVPQLKVQSSLDSTLVAAQQATNNAKDEIENLKRRLNVFSIVSVAVIAGIIFQVFSLISDTNKYISDAKNTYMDQLNKPENSIVLDINKADYEKIKTLLDEQKKEYDSRIRMLERDIYLLNLKVIFQNRS